MNKTRSNCPISIIAGLMLCYSGASFGMYQVDHDELELPTQEQIDKLWQTQYTSMPAEEVAKPLSAMFNADSVSTPELGEYTMASSTDSTPRGVKHPRTEDIDDAPPAKRLKVDSRETCPICHKKYIYLEEHMSTHNKKFTCNYKNCGKILPSRADLNHHAFTHLNKGVKCSYTGCDETFTSSRELKEHVRLHKKKMQIRRFLCTHPGCNKKFVYEEKLMAHKNSHTLGTNAAGAAAQPMAQPTMQQQIGTSNASYIPNYTPEQWEVMRLQHPAIYEAWQRYYYPQNYYPLTPF